MSTPALMRLRAALPRTQIALLTHEKLAQLWQDHPAIDRVIPFGSKDKLFELARRLRSDHYDAALLLPNSPRTALEALFARIPRRVGGAAPWRDWLLTEVVPHPSDRLLMRRRAPAEVAALIAESNRTGDVRRGTYPPEAHQMHHYLRLAAVFGASPEPLPPLLAVSEESKAGVRQRFGLDVGRIWIGINAGAEYGPAKRWPLDSFIDAIRELAGRTDCGFAIFGGPADVATAEAIEAAALKTGRPSRSLAGKTSLRELAAALACCRVVVTNDTGPMHVAAAVGASVVVPFGSTSPELTGPGMPGDPRHTLILGQAPCAPCFLRECPADFRCLRSVRPESIVAAVLERLPRG